MKKKVVIPLIVAAILAGALLYALPYVRVYQIFGALRSADAVRLSRYIDFPQLRLSLGEQARSTGSSSNRPGDMERVRQAMAMKMMEYAVEQVVTPAGLVAFFTQNLPGLMGDADKAKEQNAPALRYSTLKIFMTFLGVTRCSYTSPAEFVMTFRDGPNRPVRLVLNRTGLDWKLSRIALPRSASE